MKALVSGWASSVLAVNSMGFASFSMSDAGSQISTSLTHKVSGPRKRTFSFVSISCCAIKWGLYVTLSLCYRMGDPELLPLRLELHYLLSLRSDRMGIKHEFTFILTHDTATALACSHILSPVFTFSLSQRFVSLFSCLFFRGNLVPKILGCEPFFYYGPYFSPRMPYFWLKNQK